MSCALENPNFSAKFFLLDALADAPISARAGQARRTADRTGGCQPPRARGRDVEIHEFRPGDGGGDGSVGGLVAAEAETRA